MKLSYSKINTYSICGQLYHLQYDQGYKEKYQRASLLFGTAIDEAINVLLNGGTLEESKVIFSDQWNNQRGIKLFGNIDIRYGSSDWDKELLTPNQVEDILNYSGLPVDLYDSTLEKKSEKGFEGLGLNEQALINVGAWHSLFQKGLIILKSYQEKILPLFEKVVCVQHKTTMKNEDGDEVTQVLDFVAQLKDGRTILFDNKTTSSLSYYDDESPGMSQQLVSYYYNNKEKFKLDGVGFVAICKNISKNKTKICSICGYDGTGASHKTCPDETKGKRCKGEWLIKTNPEAAIKVITTKVSEAAEDLVLSTFDEANHGIKNKMFYKNLSVCNNIYGTECPMKKVCWYKDYSDVVKVERK